MVKGAAGILSALVAPFKWLRSGRHDAPPLRLGGAIRDNVEAIATAVVLALVIRHYVFEAFKIPTGSMAPVLLGQHKDIVCPNCGMRFEVDREVSQVNCPNCDLLLRGSDVEFAPCTCFPSLARAHIRPGGNRILVDKFAYDFKSPERDDVIVFVAPRFSQQCRDCGRTIENLERELTACPYCGSTRLKKMNKNYIKRLVGLPGDSIEIKSGDVFVDGKAARKPASAQEALWLHVYDSGLAEKKPGFHQPWWEAVEGELVPGNGTHSAPARRSLWTRNGTAKPQRFHLRTGAAGTAWARFTRTIDDYAWYNGPRTGYENVVGDLKIVLTVTPVNCRAVMAKIRVNDRPFTARLGLLGSDTPGTSLRVAGNVVAESDRTLEPGETYEIAFWHVDQTAVVAVNGRAALKWEYNDPSPEHVISSEAAFGVEGDEAVFRDVRLFRDVYYTRKSRQKFLYAVEGPERVPEDHFFVLGDNSRNSHDGRAWGFVPRKSVIGKAFFIFWPLNHLRDIR